MAEPESRVQRILDALAREIDRQCAGSVDELDLVHLATAIDAALGDDSRAGEDDEAGLESSELNAANDV